MKTNKLLSLILVAVMLMAVCIPTVYAEFSWSDVSKDAWYYDASQKAYSFGLMYGVSTDAGNPAFAPDMTMTREQFTTILERFDSNIYSVDPSRPYEKFNSKYSDYNDRKWYGKGINWAETNEITNGISDTVFGVGVSITREEIATLLFRYINKRAFIIEETDSPAGTFKDTDNISEWAKDAVEYMRKTGIMEGDENGYFNPRSIATRAETATVLTRFYESFKLDFDTVFSGNTVWNIKLDNFGHLHGEERKTKEITDTAEIKEILELICNTPIKSEDMSQGTTGDMVITLYYDKDAAYNIIKLDFFSNRMVIDYYKTYFSEDGYFDSLVNYFTPAE